MTPPRPHSGLFTVALCALFSACGGSSGDDGSGGAAAAATSGNTTVASTTSGGPACGDGMCDASENCQTCGQDCATFGSSEADTALDAEETSFLDQINNYRISNGLGPLEGCRSMHRGAQGHAEDMRDSDYFSHDGLNGSAPWDRACDACFELGCGPKTTMGENIAAGNDDATSTFVQWQNSPPHNENMLDSEYKYIGIGRALGGGEYGVYWVNIFASDSEPSCL